jgi:hypothetical protein
MTTLQKHKMELRWQQMLTLKRLSSELRQVMFTCVDASATSDLTDAILSTNKALRKLKA